MPKYYTIEENMHEHVARHIAQYVLHGTAVAVGDTINWEGRLGKEGPGNWTRGTTEAAQSHLDRAEQIMREYPQLAFETGRNAK